MSSFLSGIQFVKAATSSSSSSGGGGGGRPAAKEEPASREDERHGRREGSSERQRHHSHHHRHHGERDHRQHDSRRRSRSRSRERRHDTSSSRRRDDDSSARHHHHHHSSSSRHHSTSDSRHRGDDRHERSSHAGAPSRPGAEQGWVNPVLQRRLAEASGSATAPQQPVEDAPTASLFASSSSFSTRMDWMMVAPPPRPAQTEAAAAPPPPPPPPAGAALVPGFNPAPARAVVAVPVVPVQQEGPVSPPVQAAAADQQPLALAEAPAEAPAAAAPLHAAGGASWREKMAQRQAALKAATAAAAVVVAPPQEAPPAAAPEASEVTQTLLAPAAPAPAPAPPALSPEALKAELNKLSAAALRANMLGDAAKAAALQAKIDALQATAAHAAAASQSMAEAAVTGMLATEALIARAAAPAGARHAPGGLHAAGALGLAPVASAHGPAGPALPPEPATGGGHYPASTSQQEVVVVPTFDARGMPLRSLASGGSAPLERDDLRHGTRAGKHKAFVNKYAADGGGRTGLLREDVGGPSGTVADMLRAELETGADALDRTVTRNILRGGAALERAAQALAPHSRTGADEDDEGALEDLARLASDKSSRLTGQEAQRRDMQRAVVAHNKMQKKLDSCWYCFDGPAMKKHLVVALGEHSLLMLPPDGERLPGHLLIVPLPHIVAMADAPEEVYNEVNRFKSALHAMFSARGEDVLFLEVSLHHSRTRHTVVHAIPMDKETALDAPLYYKQAIVDAEEWTTNKVLIDTAGKGLRRCVPPGFAYFHVGWAGGGYVHPIEDEDAFPPMFGIDVAAGMLGMPPGKFGYKQQQRTFEQEKAAVLDFLKGWGPYDWTAGGAGGSGGR